MGIGEANNLLQVLLVDFSKDGFDAQAHVGIPNIVDHALEARGVVRDWELRTERSGISALEREVVPHSIAAGVFAVLAFHEVDVARGERTVDEELVDARRRDRVEVSAYDGGDLGTIVVSRCQPRWLLLGGFWGRGRRRGRGAVVYAIRRPVCVGPVRTIKKPWRQARETIGDLLQFVHHHGNLYQLDVTELRVPVNVYIGNDEPRPSVSVLEKGNDANIVLCEDAIVHVLGNV